MCRPRRVVPVVSSPLCRPRCVDPVVSSPSCRPRCVVPVVSSPLCRPRCVVPVVSSPLCRPRCVVPVVSSPLCRPRCVVPVVSSPLCRPRCLRSTATHRRPVVVTHRFVIASVYFYDTCPRPTRFGSRKVPSNQYPSRRYLSGTSLDDLFIEDTQTSRGDVFILLTNQYACKHGILINSLPYVALSFLH